MDIFMRLLQNDTFRARRTYLNMSLIHDICPKKNKKKNSAALVSTPPQKHPFPVFPLSRMSRSRLNSCISSWIGSRGFLRRSQYFIVSSKLLTLFFYPSRDNNTTTITYLLPCPLNTLFFKVQKCWGKKIELSIICVFGVTNYFLLPIYYLKLIRGIDLIAWPRNWISHLSALFSNILSKSTHTYCRFMHMALGAMTRRKITLPAASQI